MHSGFGCDGPRVLVGRPCRHDLRVKTRAESLQKSWTTIKANAENVEAYDKQAPEWSAEKIADYVGLQRPAPDVAGAWR